MQNINTVLCLQSLVFVISSLIMNLYYRTNIFTQKKNIFLELKSQGQFPEKEINVLRVLTFNLTVKYKNWDSVLHKDSRDFIPKGTTYLGIQHVYYRGSPFSFVALTSYITRKFWGQRFLCSNKSPDWVKCNSSLVSFTLNITEMNIVFPTSTWPTVSGGIQAFHVTTEGSSHILTPLDSTIYSWASSHSTSACFYFNTCFKYLVFLTKKPLG